MSNAGMSNGDTLDWLHERARRRDASTPELDVERTLDRVRAAGERPGAVNFWLALSPTEQTAFEAVARERTVPAGTVLMSEGESAVDVIVIIDGWTKICRGGRQVAERGPGQLVGEHGATPGGVRSATVIAAETVRALVIGTADYVAFAAAHPSVPALVEKQVYDRLTEQP
jgi:CRP-like cAMP-binding protein